MEKRAGKLSIVFNIMQRMAAGLDGISSEATRFNDILEGISTEIKRYNDLQAVGRVARIEKKEKIKLKPLKAAVRKIATRRIAAVGVETAPEISVSERPAAVKEKIKRVPKRKKKAAPKLAQTIPQVLFNSITAISKLKPDFAPGEVIDRAIKSTGGAVKKDSLRTALQGFKVNSKTAERLQPEYRGLIAPVEGKKNLYRLNPDKAKVE